MNDREQYELYETKIDMIRAQQEVVDSQIKHSSGHLKAVLMNESARLEAEDRRLCNECDQFLHGRNWWEI